MVPVDWDTVKNESELKKRQALSRLRYLTCGSGGKFKTSRVKKSLKYSIRSRIETTAVGFPA